MPNRYFSSADYRYGFNGMEMDDEVNGVTGSSYTAEYWQYDSRLGRRWNVDPMSHSYAWQSPYASFNNNPIVFADPLGLEGDNVIESGEVKVPEGQKAEFSKGDITKGSHDLAEFSVVEDSPAVSNSDNTNVNVNVDNRSLQEKRRSNNVSFFNYQINNNPKAVGSLIGNNSPLSISQKQSLLINYQQNGPAAQFYKRFAQEALIGAGTMGLGSAFSLARTTVGAYMADRIIIGEGANRMLLSRTFKHWGQAELRFTFGRDVLKYGGPNVTNGGVNTFFTTESLTSSKTIYNRLALDFPGSQGIFESYYVHSGRIHGFYLKGTAGRMGNTLGGAEQIFNLGSYSKGATNVVK